MKRFWRNVLTELQAVFSDRGVLVVMIVAVVFYSFVYPLPYSREVLRKVPLVVVDQDNSALSRRLVRVIDASELVGVRGQLADQDEAAAAVGSGRYSAMLVIPQGFEKGVLQARKATVAAYVDATYFLVYRQAMTGLVKAVRTLSAGIQVQRLQKQGWARQKALVDRSPLNFSEHPLFNPGMGYATYIVPGVFILILQQTMLIGIGIISGTRAERLPNGPVQLQGGAAAQVLARSAACLPLCLIHVGFIYGVAYRLWGLPLRAPLPLVFGYLFPFILAVTLLGQTLAAFFKARETAIIMIVWSSLLAVLVSGFAWPVEAMPRWIRALAMLLPSTWGISGVLRLTQMGASFGQVRFEWFWLWGLTGLYLVLALLCTRFVRGPSDC